MTGRVATVVEIESTSTPGTWYRVWVDPTGPIFCDCPGHKYARHGVRKPCRHMAAMRASGDFETAAAIAASAAATASLRATDRRVRFLEIAQEADDGSWVTIGDLSRFANLEVA